MLCVRGILEISALYVWVMEQKKKTVMELKRKPASNITKSNSIKKYIWF